MPGTYTKVNYRLRPAKNIERKMIVEALRKLEIFGKLRSYRYVGLGSTFFSDFTLVHKALGITNMVSIEKKVEERVRFSFNRPFLCVRMRFGESNDVLPLLSWSSKTILWLDYDGTLDSNVLTDIGHFCAKARAGSVIILTVNAKPGAAEDDRLNRLRIRLGVDRVPNDLTHVQLAEWGTAGAYQRIIRNEILQRIAERSAIDPPAKRLKFLQLFNFRYADGVKMVTVGGLLYSQEQGPSVKQCAFADHFEFIRSGRAAYTMNVPQLTLKELHFLDAQLPLRNKRKMKRQGIGRDAVKSYAEVYRYFPRFTEAEI